jgi:hypothetical protein
MKKHIILSLFLLLIGYAQAQKKVNILESRTFDDLTISLVETNSNERFILLNIYLIEGKGYAKLYKKGISDFVYMLDKADTRRGFHDFWRFKVDTHKLSFMIRHSKKSKFVGIGQLYKFRLGKEKRVMRQNIQPMISYINSLRRKGLTK